MEYFNVYTLYLFIMVPSLLRSNFYTQFKFKFVLRFDLELVATKLPNNRNDCSPILATT